MSLDMKRVLELEKKVEFVLKAFQVVDTTNPFARPRTLLDEFNRITNEGGVIVTDVGEPVEVHTDAPDGTIEATVVSN